MAERIGDFLMRIGAMDQAQVDEVLRIQAEDPDDAVRVFGEIAIELGFIDESAVAKYLDRGSSAS
jgi:hypothetical protein